LAYLSLDLIYDLKGQSQKLFRENVPLNPKAVNCLGYLRKSE
jgi:hypothetical protein